MELDDVEEQTSGAKKAENGRVNWDERFILYVLDGRPKSSNIHLHNDCSAAYRSSRLGLKLYCKHSTARSNHVVGEATHDVWDIPRHDSEHLVQHTFLSTILNTPSLDQIIDLHDAEQCVSGKITLCLTVAATVTFSAGPVHSLDLRSAYSLTQMTKIVESLSGEELDKFSPVWRRFIQSFGTVASMAQKISEVRKHLSPMFRHPG